MECIDQNCHKRKHINEPEEHTFFYTRKRITAYIGQVSKQNSDKSGKTL